MLCRKPFVKGTVAFPCGQCMPCRINRRRLWSHRISLESKVHTSSVFITLTYSQENLPDGGTLVPRDVQLWLKRLRKTIGIAGLRFFLVGEYGEQTQRPHYHVVLFGFPNCERGITEKRYARCCDVCEVVKSTWSKGAIEIRELTTGGAEYIAGYVTKKLTNANCSRTWNIVTGKQIGRAHV